MRAPGIANKSSATSRSGCGKPTHVRRTRPTYTGPTYVGRILWVRRICRPAQNAEPPMTWMRASARRAATNSKERQGHKGYEGHKQEGHRQNDPVGTTLVLFVRADPWCPLCPLWYPSAARRPVRDARSETDVGHSA